MTTLFPMPTPTEQTEQNAAQTPETRRIWETGVLIDLEIHQWTGTSALDSSDLGLPALPEIYQLGRKYLVPRHLLREIQATAQRAYRTLEQYSVPFPVGRSRFVPLQAAPTLIGRLDAIRADFNQAVDRFIAAYAEVWSAVMSREYEQAARAAYQIARATGALGDIHEDDFVREYLDRTRAAYPLPETVRSKFSMTYQAYQISAPEVASLGSAAHARELAATAREAYRRRVEAFLEDAVAELRARVAQACTEAAETLARSGTVTEHTLRALRAMVDNFRALNFVGDAEVERMLLQLQTNYLSAPARTLRETNAVPAMRAALDAIVAAARDQAGISRVTGELKRRIVIDT
jgi:hypothetical protein